MTEREKLVEELWATDFYKEHGVDMGVMADFILKDRARICEPLVRLMPKSIGDCTPNEICDAIYETLKLASLKP